MKLKHLHPIKALFALALATLATIAHADPGMLRITTSPGDAQIFINGQRKGNSPSQEGQTFAVKLPQGQYTVEAKKSDGSDYYGKKSVFVANDSLQTVDISLDKVVLPPTPYGNKPNGSVSIAGREWLRCSVGQAWDGSTCIGQAKHYTFEQAKEMADKFNATGYGGKRDWRVPTVRELQSLRECSTGFSNEKRDIKDGGEHVAIACNDNAAKPTINTSLFHKTPTGGYWSSSPYVGDSYGAWYVGFVNGGVVSFNRNSSGYVRLVR